MSKIIASTFAIGLLLSVAACGSDDKITSTTVDTTASADTTAAAADTPASQNTPASDDTMTTEGAAAPADTADTTAAPAEQIPGLSTSQSEVVGITLDAAAAVGIQIDEDCFIAVAGQLSEADAQLIIAAGAGGSPTLSTEGEALGAQAAACVTTDFGPTATIESPTT